jgi:FlaG/FlaF family flagellin (archaellin)
MTKINWHYLKKNDHGVSPLIGVILMLFLTILFAGITVSVVYGDGFSSSLGKAPMAVIEVEDVVGGVSYGISYGENYLYLIHKGGDPLFADSIKIIISGEGSSYEGVVPSGTKHYGNVLIIYDSLLFDGKLSQYASNNPDISDGVWSTGEKLVLNGKDSIDGSSSSSVFVSINEITDTANNYGLKEGNVVSIKVFDKNTDCLIAECSHKVTLAA